MTDYRANYAMLSFQKHLGPDDDELTVPWATFAGDETDPKRFDVPTDDPREPYVGMQVYEVGTYGHDVVVNDESLAGFDVPPGEEWQYWMDTIPADRLRRGANTIRFSRAEDESDSFVVGTVTVHWKEPVE